MKHTLNILIFIGLLVIGSCFNPPEFSIVPNITVESVRTFEVVGPNTPDSLIVTVSFRDGDGDIGLAASENDPPYNERWFFLKSPISKCETGLPSPCNKVSFVDTMRLGLYVSYKLRRTTPGYDTLPEFIKPYDCSRYYVVKNKSDKPIDTIYSELNPRYSNFLMDIMLKNGASFNKYDFNIKPYPDCEIYGLNGRMPILAKDGDVSAKLPLEGSITYKWGSRSFYSTLRNKTIKLKIQMMDRAGNISNEDFSKEFTLK